MAERLRAARNSSAGRRVLVAWVLCSTLGVAVLAAPDADDRVLSLSDDHGLSRLVVLGVALLVAGWMLPLTAAWNGRRRARQRLGKVGIAILAVACLAGAVVLVVTIGEDVGSPWLLGVALLGGVHVVVLAASR